MQALVALGRALAAEGYRFVTVTPETHRRVLGRAPQRARSLRDVFGWSRPFERALLPKALIDLLAAAGALHEGEDGLRSGVRFSTRGAHLFAHSSYPTHDVDAVFFGPDTHRFCAAIERASLRAHRLVDVGCGSGAGGIVARAQARRVVLADVNDDALCFSRVNAELAGISEVELVKSDVLAQIDGDFDAVIANPPYLLDAHGRTYRDGGGDFGEALAARIVEESLARMSRGGTLLLYTGAAIVEGEDTFFRAIRETLKERAATVEYTELDPDVFGEELERPDYAAVDRIAAVVLTATRA